jgi:hypothetical protein
MRLWGTGRRGAARRPGLTVADPVAAPSGAVPTVEPDCMTTEAPVSVCSPSEELRRERARQPVTRLLCRSPADDEHYRPSSTVQPYAASKQSPSNVLSRAHARQWLGVLLAPAPLPRRLFATTATMLVGSLLDHRAGDGLRDPACVARVRSLAGLVGRALRGAHRSPPAASLVPAHRGQREASESTRHGRAQRLCDRTSG